ncbi:MAG: ribosome biogenesis GTPase Der [Gammaproteobacteria bacterium]|nr:ribosome biogenesis GTPase Der [Gammaproteobacteria bacterium]TVQ47412.1 MAG: ribosome biogenesis GTPase Der [Gammaproteobacteria bacterium]
MLPVIALAGRPNVGKSTLFNRLTGTRDALVADYPGLTRDRQYGFGRIGAVPYVLVDTGGVGEHDDDLSGLMAGQTWRALDEADAVILLVDARGGLTAGDQRIVSELRRRGRRVQLAVNKAEGLDPDVALADFQALGLGEGIAISSAHGDRVTQLIDAVLAPWVAAADESPPAEQPAAEEGITVAIVGRPNVGKSTLVNRLVGEQRVVAFDQPGTTRDSIRVPFERNGQRYTLIDTAGIRRRARVEEAIEKFSIVKALQAIDAASVVIALFDASEGVTEQDATLLGLVLERGRALVLGLNKWDGLSAEQRERTRRQMDVRLPFIDFAPRHFISALHGTGVGDLLDDVRRAHRAATADLPTPELTRVLAAAVAQHPPPLVRGRRIRLRYAHQGGRNPPVIVIHGNQTESVPKAYRRFLVNRFREAFRLHGAPIRLEFRSGTNPYAGKRNTLTPRQRHKRDRLMKHQGRRGR